MPPLTLKAYSHSLPLEKPFRISRGVRTTANMVVAEISDGTHTGRGECMPYPRYGETIESVLELLENVAKNEESFATLEACQNALPPGAARNALDCARLDFEAKKSGRSVASRFALTMKPQVTAFTLGIDTPSAMYEAAKTARDRQVLKIKLGAGDEDIERLSAVRRGSPKAKLIVDANEGWKPEDFDHHLKSCIENNVGLIEQPLPAGDDDALLSIKSPIPICADESLHTRQELDHIEKRYDAINIKLDKTGGLSEAMVVLEEAEKRGLIIMVGCMLSSSLSMAPAVLVAQRATWVDLDGPLLLARDCDNALSYEGSTILPPTPQLWG